MLSISSLVLRQTGRNRILKAGLTELGTQNVIGFSNLQHMQQTPMTELYILYKQRQDLYRRTIIMLFLLNQDDIHAQLAELYSTLSVAILSSRKSTD